MLSSSLRKLNHIKKWLFGGFRLFFENHKTLGGINLWPHTGGERVKLQSDDRVVDCGTEVMVKILQPGAGALE